MKIMFLDESGNHDLDRVDPQYPVFVLGGVIVDRAYARAVVEPRLRDFKRAFFGRDDVVLHTAELIRHQNDFACLEDPALKERCLHALTALMRELDYQVVACAIRKDRLATEHGRMALDPYHYSLHVLVERFVLDVGNAPNGGIIFAEKRRPDLDHALEMAWQRLRATGTRHAKPDEIDARIVDLGLKDKKLNVAGLQLADLVVSPIGRAVIGKPTRDDWNVVQSKFRRHRGSYKGYGLVVIPDTE